MSWNKEKKFQPRIKLERERSSFFPQSHKQQTQKWNGKEEDILGRRVEKGRPWRFSVFWTNVPKQTAVASCLFTGKSMWNGANFQKKQLSGGMKSGKWPDQRSHHSLLFCLCSGFRPRSSQRSRSFPVHALELRWLKRKIRNCLQFRIKLNHIIYKLKGTCLTHSPLNRP